jgi:tetratricopeptide (TPR) repeat protein
VQSRRLAAPFAAALVALGGCATTSRAFQCPTSGGPPWRELTSDHFVLRTDLPEPEAGQLLGKVERLHAAIAAGLPGATEPPSGRSEVIAFRTLEEFRPFSPDRALGYYVRYEGGPPRIVVPGEIGPWQHGMLAHEITHDFLANAYQRQPRWFAEGLAVYMESVEEASEGRIVVAGKPSPDRLERVRASRVPVRELLAWEGTAGSRPSLDYYASSWLLVHWLVHERPDAFAEMRRHFQAGTPPEVAWRAALPEYDPERDAAAEALDGMLAAYARGTLATRSAEARAVPAVGYFDRPIPTPEVHAIRLAIWQFGPRKGEAALRSEVAEILAEDAAHPIGLEYLSVLDRTDPAPLARRAVAGHPDDARAHTFLAEALRGTRHAAEREAALRRAVELSPGNPAALHNLAQALLADGRSGEALPLARRAARLAPWSPFVLAGYAEVLADLGQCSAAIAVQQRAIDAIPDGASADGRRSIVARLTALEDQCRVALEGAAR